MADKPLVYLILGASGSGRREILADLIAEGVGEDESAAVLLAADEVVGEWDAKLPSLARWTRDGDSIQGDLPAGVSRIFFIADGRANPVELVEPFKNWLQLQGAELARVLCVVNCQLVEKHPAMLAWFEACIHFSDLVLLTRREGVPNKWMSEFRGHFEGLFYPCLFEMVKGGRVKNPALVLEPQARRMSHYLDEEQDWIFTDVDGVVIDEDEESEGEQEIEAKPEEDIYLVRDAAGRRAKKVPDARKYLGEG